MRRNHPTTSAADLRDWLARHVLTIERGGIELGVSRSTMALYLAGRPIPDTVGRLMTALDRLGERQISD